MKAKSINEIFNPGDKVIAVLKNEDINKSKVYKGEFVSASDASVIISTNGSDVVFLKPDDIVCIYEADKKHSFEII